MFGSFVLLIVLMILCAFFSAAETGMMSINRYRLRHKVQENFGPAKRVSQLLTRPDRLLGLILIGNTCVNVVASSIATVMAMSMFGDFGVAVVTAILTFVILVFGETTPKTLAALYPEKVAYKSSIFLMLLMKITYPLVWAINTISNSLLRSIGIKVKAKSIDRLSHEELRTLVREAVGKSSLQYQEMLLGILDLGRVTVEDIMVPRHDIVGINLHDDWEDILSFLMKCEHTRILLYEGSIEKSLGFLHMRKALNLIAQKKLNKTSLKKIIDPMYVIPEATPLNILLLKMRHQKSRIGIVVDEYGDILGLATLEDILEEIVGEFTTGFSKPDEHIQLQKDGSVIVDGGINVRDLNRNMHWDFPTEGPKTLSGLIVECLEEIPEEKVCVRIEGYPIEVVEVVGNMIKQVRVMPNLKTSVVDE